ncbi:MAG: DEAD/DEAH box helicase [Rhodospirillales bacterium]|nr:DEAD/DEAH box helicase [Alphaproteobacteria bacterium]MBL6948156.1 DEAD/DEAH box helicase [Rhodospirillales bacterium]
MTFNNLGLSDEVLRALEDSGYTEPTPIQSQAIPVVFMGRDILGCAQTGTGKTASFTLPMIDILAAGKAKARMPRSLILEPTRELAAQVAENFDKYGKYHKLTKALLIGGHTMNAQIKTIDKGVDVLIATPGRLLDLFDRGHLLMHDVKILVIDEADRMLDMGFIPDVEKIVAMLPTIRNTLFFSATMPPEIRRLADKFLMNPKEISVSPPATTADTITQGMVVVQHRDGRRPGGGAKEKRAVLRNLIKREKPKNALIFCNRKRDVDVVCKSLNTHGITASRLHGDMSQPARTETLGKFKSGEINIVVCSDVAARGLDIPAMSHVFNFDVPIHAEDYVHRIGRTGRAGLKGHAYTIATPEDGKYLDAIYQVIGKEIPQLDMNGVEIGTLEDSSQAAGETSGRGRSSKSEGPGTRGGRDRGGRSGGRGRGGRGGRTKDSKAEQKPAEPKAAHKAEPKAEHKTERKTEHKAGASEGKSKTPERKKEPARQPAKETVKGLGEHMPAFLMTEAPKKK